MHALPLSRPSRPVFAALAALLLAAAPARATTFVKDVMVIGHPDKDAITALKNTYTGQGWTVIDYDLNKGCGSGTDYIYLLYRGVDIPGANASYDLVTGFYLKSASGANPPENLTYGNRTYYLAPFVGGQHFTDRHGDLNSNANGDTIHLYYTKDPVQAGYAVSSIEFNDTSSGGVCKDDTSTPYDLNAGCGSGTAYIYMHVSSSIVTYSITYDTDGGSTPNNPSTYNVNTTTFTLNNPTRTGYTFAGWTGSNGTTPQTTVTIAKGSTGARSYTANWTPINYSITYNTAGGSLPSGTSNPGSYNIESATFTLPTPTCNGYAFA